MKKPMGKSFTSLCLMTTCLIAFSTASLAASKSKSSKYVETPRPKVHYLSEKKSPWDFTGFIGLYAPGVGVGGLASYRLVEDLIPNTENDLVVESGLSYVYATDTFATTSLSFSFFEIPFQARWDFRILNSKLYVGPRIGLNYLTGAVITSFGNTYNRWGGIYPQVGVSGIYYFTENFGARAVLSIGGYTSFLIGLNYTP